MVVNEMKTHTVKAADIKEQWHLFDADDKPLGRLASEIACVLRGKHRPEYSPHLSLGDHVIVVNAEKIYLSGTKRQNKLYYRYTGYQGGLKVRTLQEAMDKDPTRVVRAAVKGMLPHNRLGRSLLRKLKVYTGPEHPHGAQTPAEYRGSQK
jgi:large subunit ribosomal protein L13